MAGYFIDSIPWEPLEQFLVSPTDEQLEEFASIISDKLDEYDCDFSDDDIMANWPSDPSDLAPILKSHMLKEDWYERFTTMECDAWSWGLVDFFQANKGIQVHNLAEPVYWNIVEEVVKHHESAGTSGVEFSHFGKRPWNYKMPKKQDMDSWMPYHSLHSPNEAKAMRLQLIAAEDACLNSDYEEVPREYPELLEAFDNLEKKGHALLITVDT